MLVFKSEIMDEAAVARTVTRLSHELLERQLDGAPLCLIGIKRRGVPLAQMLAARIFALMGLTVPVGSVDITLYRDDLSPMSDQPRVSAGDIPFPIQGARAVLVDDVFYTGRTARAAMDAVFSFGRPAKIELLMLIDRGHRELPIRADYVGKNIETSKGETVSVCLPPFDAETCVRVYRTET